MECMYVVTLSPELKSSDNKLLTWNIYPDMKSYLRISPLNIAVWVTDKEINASDANLSEWKSYVYITDLSAPWNYYNITRTQSKVTHIEWDFTGEYIMMAEESGTMSVWSCKDHVINDWMCVGNHTLPGEKFVAGIFFHHGKKLSYAQDKKDSVIYYEKFARVPFNPTVCGAGGASLDGCVFISSTGVLCVMVITRDSTRPLVCVTENLTPSRVKLSRASFCYWKDGRILVVVSDGGYINPIKCYDVAIRFLSEWRFLVECHHLCGFFLQDAPSLSVVAKLQTVSHLSFCVYESPDALVTVTNGDCKSVIQIWQCEENVRVPSTAEEAKTTRNTIQWKLQAKYLAPTSVVAMCTPKLIVGDQTPSAFYTVVAFASNIIKVFNRELKEECGYNIGKYWEKQRKKKSFQYLRITAMDVTWISNLVVVLDCRNNIYLLQISSVAELGMPSTAGYATLLLEFCMLSGYDWWDLAVSIKPPMLEAVFERFADNFTKQHGWIQEYEFATFSSIKASLCQMVTAGDSKNVDLIFLTKLNSVCAAFKSIIRPSDLLNADKGPYENLSSAISETQTDNIDTVLTSVDSKGFTVEKDTLLSLQQLIQWVANLALVILERVPEKRKIAGYDISKDTHALNIIREILVIVRMWSFLRPACAPIFVKKIFVENFDGLSFLFRLITRLIQCNQNSEIDEAFSDDCCLLYNQVLIQPLTESENFGKSDFTALLCKGQCPTSFVYGEENYSDNNNSSYYLDANARFAPNLDVIRQTYLGSFPKNVKQCNKCGGKTAIAAWKNSNSEKRTPAALRSWENRWVKTCICGGKWRTMKSNTSEKWI